MANKAKFLSLACALGVVTGCGSIPGYDSAMNTNEIVEKSEAALPNEIESDQAAFALSIPVAEKSKKGAIVVERAIYLPLAYQLLPAVYPPPPEKTCLVHAGSHLINLKYSGDFTFSAEVSYPKGLKIILNRKSCKQGEIINVRAGSGFRGLAVVSNKQATHFQKELTYIPVPQPPLNPLEPACDLPLPKPQSGAIEGSDNQAEGVTTLTNAPSTEYTSPALCKTEDGTGWVQCPGIPKPPKPPVVFHMCTVHAGRQNIKIHASKEHKHISGTAVTANKAIAEVAILGECKFGEKLLADTTSLAKALGYDR